jgi:phenylpropionate dioxygenase-like ring-hydroxylating dioxygenase large terminal subunit
VNWKIALEVFLEDYHVGFVHPGFRSFVAASDLRGEPDAVAGTWFFFESVGVNWPLERVGSPLFAEYQKILADVQRGRQPPFGAVWLCYYPNAVIEWYPHTLVISTYQPLAPERTRVCSQYYFTPEIARDRRDYVAAAHAIFGEVGREDLEITELLHHGRRMLYQQGRDDRGPYHEPMEQGLLHFHRFLKKLRQGEE